MEFRNLIRKTRKIKNLLFKVGSFYAGWIFSKILNKVINCMIIIVK